MHNNYSERVTKLVNEWVGKRVSTLALKPGIYYPSVHILHLCSIV